MASTNGFMVTMALAQHKSSLFLNRDLKIQGREGEDGKARTGTAVDAGNFRGSRCVIKNKMLKMSIFSKDGDVNNSNFVKAVPFTETVTSFRL